MKLSIFKTQEGFYDVAVLDPRATVQDYLDAINQFIDNNAEPPCKGCDECCWERIPLTSIDALHYLRELGQELELDKDWPLLDFLQRYTYVYAEGGAVDISLGFTLEGACGFLDQEQKICSSYTARSLVCQSFICLESSERAQELRSELVNQGMDELVRLWLTQSKAAGVKLTMQEHYGPEPQLADYPANAFTGKQHYGEVLLQEVCPPNLWKKLFTSGK